MSNEFRAVLGLLGVAVLVSGLVWGISLYRRRDERRYWRRMRATRWVKPLGGMTFSATCGRVRAQLTPIDYSRSDRHFGQGLWIVVVSPAPKGLAGCERLLRKPSLSPTEGPSSVATATGHGRFDEEFHCVEPTEVHLDKPACDALVALNDSFPLVSLTSWDDSVELRLKRSEFLADEGLRVLRAVCDLTSALESKTPAEALEQACG